MKRIVSILLTAVFVLALAQPAIAASKVKSASMRLAAVEGTVKVTNKNGKALTVSDDMNLYNGYIVTTSAKSYAYISIDGDKAVKLDAGTQAEIRTSGKKLELRVIKGKLFCNVKTPLKKDETLNISTSTTVTGIRGTSLSISSEDDVTQIQVYSGQVVTAVYNAMGEIAQEMGVAAGEKVSGTADGSVTSAPLGIDDIPGFIAVLLSEDPQLKAIMENIGLDAGTLIEKAAEILQRDQDAKGDKDVRENTPAPSPQPTPTPTPAPAPAPQPTPEPPTNPTPSPTKPSPNPDDDDDEDDGNDDDNVSRPDPDPNGWVAFDINQYSPKALRAVLRDSRTTGVNLYTEDNTKTRFTMLHMTIPERVKLETQGMDLKVTGTLTLYGSLIINRGNAEYGMYGDRDGYVEINKLVTHQVWNATANPEHINHGSGFFRIENGQKVWNATANPEHINLGSGFFRIDNGQMLLREWEQTSTEPDRYFGFLYSDMLEVHARGVNMQDEPWFFGSWDAMTEVIEDWSGDTAITIHKNIETTVPLQYGSPSGDDSLHINGEENHSVTYNGSTSPDFFIEVEGILNIEECDIIVQSAVGGIYAGSGLFIDDSKVAVSDNQSNNKTALTLGPDCNAVITGDSRIYADYGKLVEAAASAKLVVGTDNPDETFFTKLDDLTGYANFYSSRFFEMPAGCLRIGEEQVIGIDLSAPGEDGYRSITLNLPEPQIIT